jgi:HPt (histidine-containing phosphotransfer) domain-containing protein
MFPAIAGVDTASGIMNAGGNPRVYADILSDFCRDAAERGARLSRAAEAGDIALYIILVHALKGAAKSVGAIGLAKLAARLEEAAKNGEIADICEKTSELLQCRSLLIENIRAALDRVFAKDEGGEIELSRLHIEDLKAALADMDFDV